MAVNVGVIGLRLFLAYAQMLSLLSPLLSLLWSSVSMSLRFCHYCQCPSRVFVGSRADNSNDMPVSHLLLLLLLLSLSLLLLLLRVHVLVVRHNKHSSLIVVSCTNKQRR